MSAEANDAAGDYARRWISALKPYGPAEKTWICPSMQREFGDPDYLTPENTRTDYVATAFDDKPATPHHWAGQPWFVEMGALHGKGQLMVLSDGTISMTKPPSFASSASK
jgi:hypothetical protein